LIITAALDETKRTGRDVICVTVSEKTRDYCAADCCVKTQRQQAEKPEKGFNGQCP
jgi:hypothetical protein